MNGLIHKDESSQYTTARFPDFCTFHFFIDIQYDKCGVQLRTYHIRKGVRNVDFQELIKRKSQTMTVPEMGQLLGLGKTDSYWLAHQGKFECFQLKGRYFIKKQSFEQWYANQIKYKKVNGPPPGSELNEHSYSVSDLTKLLGVTGYAIYTRIKNGDLETFLVDGWIRITKESFDKWYSSQSTHRTVDDKERDSQAEQASISLTDVARLLGTHRNNIYSLLQSHPEHFEIIVIAGRKRITLDSFEKWYQSQKKYKKVVVSELAPLCDPLEPELMCECEQESETTPTEDAVPSEDKKYYTVDEVREILLLSKRDVYDIVQSGHFKVIQIGRRYLVPKDSFDEWRMQNNT